MVQLLDVNGEPLKAAPRMRVSDTAHRAASVRARELASWMPLLGSADSDLLSELPTLVSRSRDLTRNHGVAAGAIQTLVDNVIGTGLRLAAIPDYRVLGKTKEWADDWARQVESEWRSWAESTECDAANALTFSGMTALVFRSSIVNGEALALPLWLDQRGTRYATTIQLVECDRLSNPAGRQDGKTLRSGIEIDTYGAALAYHVRKSHPGDAYIGYLTRGETDHVNVKGAILHVMGDLLGSAGAIMAAVVILTTGWTPIDPILSVLVALLVLRSAWSLLKKTMHILLEGAPTNADAISITSHLLQTVDGIEKISHVHVWLITSGRSLATLQVQPKEGVNLPSIVKKIEDELKEKFGIEHPTVGIDWHGDSSCSLENAPKLDAHAGHNH